jgi:glutathione S-transferase
MEAESAEDKANWGPILAGCGYPAWLARALACAMPFARLAARVREERSKRDSEYGPLQTMREYFGEFRAAIGDRSFLGGDEACIVDVSFYGTVTCWRRLPKVQLELKAADLMGWFARMGALMPSRVPGDP